MSKSTTLADLMVTALNANDFSIEFTAIRTFMPVYNRKTVDGLLVSVVPAPITNEVRTHTTKGYQIQIDIGVQAPVTPDDNTNVDAYADLLEEIDDFLVNKDFGSAAWLQTETITGAESGYAPEHLYNANLFTGLLRATYLMVS